MQLVPEGTPGAAVVAVKRVEELGFYNLGRDQLAEKVGLTGPKTTAMIRFLKLKSDPDSYKEKHLGAAVGVTTVVHTWALKISTIILTFIALCPAPATAPIVS